MKFNLKVFKKGKPIYWVIGGIVIFVVFYLMFSRGSSSGGGTTVVSSGPSEALQAAQLQANTAAAQTQAQVNLGAAQIAADYQTAVLASQVQLAQITSSENVNMAGLQSNTQLQLANFDTQKQLGAMQYNYALESAKSANETALAAKTLDTQYMIYQTNAMVQMYETQSKNLIAQSALGQISNLKKGDRDNALISLMTGQPSSHGSITGGGTVPGLLSYL